MSIYQTARFEVRPEALEICQQAIRVFIEYVRVHEPDTLSYISLQENEDPSSSCISSSFATRTPEIPMPTLKPWIALRVRCIPIL